VISISFTMSDIFVYRKLALEFHPDKIALNASDEEIEMSKLKFLAVQLAHEVLSDSIKRMQYDLTLLGSNSKPDVIIPHYSKFPFSLDLRSRMFSLHFSIIFSQQDVSTIFIIEEIDLKDIYNIVAKNKSFYRQIPCPICGGTGGDNITSCRTCTLCGGDGQAGHLHSDMKHSYIHVMNGTCSKCAGLGCIPSGKCLHCEGQGMILQEGAVAYQLPMGFPDGYTLVFANEGHRMRDGRSGNLSITYRHRAPDGWRLVPDSSDLVYEMEISVQELVEGFQRDILCPNGQIFQVYAFGESLYAVISLQVACEPSLSVDILVTGWQMVAKDYGTVSIDGRKGDLIIEILPSWDDVSMEVWESILLVRLFLNKRRIDHFVAGIRY
jgi:molecular chaperone DnaJ